MIAQLVCCVHDRVQRKLQSSTTDAGLCPHDVTAKGARHGEHIVLQIDAIVADKIDEHTCCAYR